MEQALLIGFVVATIVVVIIATRRSRQLRREQKALHDAADAHAQIAKLAEFILADVPGEPSQSEGAVDTAIRLIKNGEEYRAALSDQTEAIDRVGKLAMEVNAQAEASDALARRYFNHIETIGRERDEVWALYHDANSGMANAQALMLAEIDRLSHAAKVDPDPKFKELRDEFVKRHDEADGAPSKVARAPEPPDPPPPPVRRA
jgi:gas vesicle protein